MTNRIKMDYQALKNLMRRHLGDVVDSNCFEYLFVNDPDIEHYYSKHSKSKGFTHLHKCVMLTINYPNLNNYLEEYFRMYGNDDINEANAMGWTALHMACYHSKNYSTERTVGILINAGSNVNLQAKYGSTALHLVSDHDYFKTSSTQRIVKLLIIAGGDIFNLKNIYGETPYDLFSKEQKDYCQIDEATKTIGIKIGRLTKSAKK